MSLDSNYLYDRPASEHFLSVLRRLRDDTHAVVESGPAVIELVSGYILFIDPGDSSSGFTASVRFSPPHTDEFDVTVAERRFEGGKADLLAFVIETLSDDVANLDDRLQCWDRITAERR